MNFFEQELKRITNLCDNITDPVFAGRACYADVGEDNRIKLQFVTGMVADNYNSIRATVFNRVGGEVDTMLLRFSDIWGHKKVSNPNFEKGIIPHIWTDRGKSDWYVYRPNTADFKEVATVLNNYLSVFKVQETTLQKDSVVDKLREGKTQVKSKPAKDSPTAKKTEPEL